MGTCPRALLPATIPCRGGCPSGPAGGHSAGLSAEVRQSPLYTVTPEGGSVNITCSIRVSGTLQGVYLRQSYLPEMRKVTYYDNESTPTVDARFRGRVVFSGTMDNLTITMQRLRPEDSGAYFCEAIVEDGQGWGSGTTLVVTGRQHAHPRGHCPPCPSWAASPHSRELFPPALARLLQGASWILPPLGSPPPTCTLKALMDSPHFFPDTLSPAANTCPGTQLTGFTFPVALVLGCLLVVLGLAAVCVLKRRQVSMIPHGHCLRKPAAPGAGKGEKRLRVTSLGAPGGSQDHGGRGTPGLEPPGALRTQGPGCSGAGPGPGRRLRGEAHV